jgi:hypothetical protein
MRIPPPENNSEMITTLPLPLFVARCIRPSPVRLWCSSSHFESPYSGWDASSSGPSDSLWWVDYRGVCGVVVQLIRSGCGASSGRRGHAPKIRYWGGHVRVCDLAASCKMFQSISYLMQDVEQVVVGVDPNKRPKYALGGSCEGLCAWAERPNLGTIVIRTEFDHSLVWRHRAMHWCIRVTGIQLHGLVYAIIWKWI